MCDVMYDFCLCGWTSWCLGGLLAFRAVCAARLLSPGARCGLLARCCVLCCSTSLTTTIPAAQVNFESQRSCVLRWYVITPSSCTASTSRSLSLHCTRRATEKRDLFTTQATRE